MQEKLLNELIDIVVKESASDLHLSEGRPPVIRVSNFLIPLVKMPVLSRTTMEGFLKAFLSPEMVTEFENRKEVNFAYSNAGKMRFRCNAFLSLGKLNVAMRLVPTKVKSLEELNLPPILETFAKRQQGFFLVVGPVGVGKSTTLATMIEAINLERLEHIITIEDPVEYIFESKKAIIDQREVKLDTPDFHGALQGIFRQDADIVMIGEMRDPETISTAVTAAETGHLVLSTLHTNNASQTVDRIIDSFPADQQTQIRIQLAGSLLGIFSQRLLPRISGGLIPAYELLINNSATANLIRDKRTQEISSVIETSSEEGMVDLNRHLAGLVRSGEVTIENAFLFSSNPKTLERMI
ncbi:MAG: type IV pili twitching motility protein PilT [Candidatus Zambryskibacteria bacterium RIFCSPHIGHO2_01_FULL_46_30]|uniref:Type IV pili twitching motility protein PilT n=1 Tax=Candidatus Zambryskibacteria bacterium RIFCSPHIGHO2_01_FULL_46_30 TaxID=1802739 RepID=A0A1G2T5S8_9BACT|nr:MAG: Twitching motility protein [Parcubacteria group bacterium GW2011_GWB1_49_7]OHA92502.1 MAG: type IV pili twitching motility protein PilT [Candidatus Zambryskibacteria bacterium RIFCSPHIGHO2_01_FULL_46_30]OHB06637.1 MAG: type IV pili twitching motility protein PilT [Candidatus Zambryskibacteria bacterium RIFCSPLOWO2_01_FULL_47_33]